MSRHSIELIEKGVNPLTDIADLEDRGVFVVETLAGDVAPTEQMQRFLERLQHEKKETFFGDVLYYLTSERYPESQAAVMWTEIMNHKFYMSEKLKRNIGIRVAAIDYLVNIRGLLLAPRIMNSNDYRQTVKMARTDPLTGLYNRRYFIDQTNRFLEAANRLKAPVTLMMTDLDHFKQFNDQNGHQAGDLILQEVARLVRGCVRNSDIVARYGGDEMALLLPKANRVDAVAVAEKIRVAIEENCHEMGITISIGIAQYPDDATSRDDLISAADDVLYRAKEFGGNKAFYFHPISIRYDAKDPQVQTVSVVGDFNNWSKRTLPMARQPNGEWELTVRLKPGRYRYKLFVNNGQWVPDPSAPLFEDDGFGGQCSIMVVR
ncbi:MAG TPA: diguanylate cyclase [Elusimicrobiota bacterium]|nr:diguanylate cyclase [Elusimicrobiota bacterium]